MNHEDRTEMFFDERNEIVALTGVRDLPVRREKTMLTELALRRVIRTMLLKNLRASKQVIHRTI